LTGVMGLSVIGRPLLPANTCDGAPRATLVAFASLVHGLPLRSDGLKSSGLSVLGGARFGGAVRHSNAIFRRLSFLVFHGAEKSEMIITEAPEGRAAACDE
jgi:hypothetical protein